MDTNQFANHPINANSHPDAKIIFHAFHQASNKRSQKLKIPLQVNRPHHFDHPPYTIKLERVK